MDLRSYDPAIARFTSMDPVTHHSMSPFMAFDGNPVFWADPSGADAQTFVNDGSAGFANAWNSLKNESKSWGDYEEEDDDEESGPTDIIRINKGSKKATIGKTDDDFDVVYEDGVLVNGNAKKGETEKRLKKEGYSLWYPYANGMDTVDFAIVTLAGERILSWTWGGVSSLWARAFAAKGGMKLISQFSSSTIDDAVAYAMKNKVTHVFGKAAHNLDQLVTKLGGQENTFRAVLNAANGKLRIK